MFLANIEQFTQTVYGINELNPASLLKIALKQTAGNALAIAGQMLEKTFSLPRFSPLTNVIKAKIFLGDFK